jgi:4-diphosphocytidyl-2-C-methyl-D-erythritol kinase
MTGAKAYAKINLGLIVGPQRADGKHELVTVLQRVGVHDDVGIEPASRLEVTGFPGDTIVSAALELLAESVGVEPSWHVGIEKRIPIAAGLGGGSTDAAAALELANALLPDPLGVAALHRLGARVGADVPFFLHAGAQLATGDGTELAEVSLPSDYHVVLVVPRGVTKQSTADVYAAFDARSGADGFRDRAASFRDALAGVRRARDLAALPANDLASSPIGRELTERGAFRADVSGAGPAVYGLFEDASAARAAAEAFAGAGQTFVTRPVAR